MPAGTPSYEFFSVGRYANSTTGQFQFRLRQDRWIRTSYQETALTDAEDGIRAKLPPMQFELQFTNEATTLPVVSATLDEVLGPLPLDADVTSALHKLTLDVVRDAIEHAYPSGAEGFIKLTIQLKRNKLEILVRDYGMPQDIERLEHRYQQAQPFDKHIVDQVHWCSFGPDGKEFQIVKWLDTVGSIRDAGTEDNEPPSGKDIRSPQQEYKIQRMTEEQAVQVSQLMYRAYGNTYFNEDVYFPERVATQNAEGKVLSIVAVDTSGDVAGHYALELNQDGPVAEGGQAVVHPAHRGRGLLDRMKQLARQQAQELKLDGWFADAVSVHTRTQQSHIDHGGQLTAVDLGVAPRSESFNQIANEQPQRVTCMLYFYWLNRPTVRTIYVPTRHHAFVSQIYQNLECPIQMGVGGKPTGHGRSTVQVETRAARAWIRAGQLGTDTVDTICHAKRRLVEHTHIEAVFVELPLEDEGTPHVAEELQVDGFGFIGVVPHFSTRGDVLRLVYLVDPLARKPIQTVDAFAAQFVDYALTEQARLR